MDKDKDGKLSKDEFTRNWPDAKKAGQLFDQADKNKDGALTLDEFKAGGDKMIPQFATTLDAGSAKPPPKKKTPQQHAKTRVEAAMTVLNDAKKKLDEAKRHAKDEAEKSRHAESEAEAARKSLREIEAKLEEMQPSQSAFGKARDAFKAAGQAYHAAENRALNASEYKAAYQHAMDASDGPALASLRKETLAKDAAVRQTLATLEAAKAVYEPMQVELFGKDPQWQKTRQKVLDKERAIRDREGRAKGAISEVRRARAKVQEAENMLEAAMQAVPYTGAHRRR
jgi:DNA repair exonuclease SbcCD ATPase subunit